MLAVAVALSAAASVAAGRQPLAGGAQAHFPQQAPYAGPGAIPPATQTRLVRELAGGANVTMYLRTGLCLHAEQCYAHLYTDGQLATVVPELLRNASAQGVRVLANIGVEGFVARYRTPAAIESASFAYAAAIARELRPLGVRHYELGNEEDNRCLLGGNGDKMTEYNQTKYRQHLGWLRGLCAGVRSADPTAVRVVSNAGWLHTGWFDMLDRDGLQYLLRAISMSTYPHSF
eukprot:COSAG04_NODE_1845_length_5416_cov_26.535076_3_plen_232_part_00